MLAGATAWVRTISSPNPMAGRQLELVAELLREAAEEVLAYMAFPPGHRRRIHSTNPLERLLWEAVRCGGDLSQPPGGPAADRGGAG